MKSSRSFVNEFLLVTGIIFILITSGIIGNGLYNYFTIPPEERTVKYGASHVEVCIEGIRYIRGLSSKSSFTVLVDKEGKPLNCNY